MHVFADIRWRQSASITVRGATLRADLWPSNEKINLTGVKEMLPRTLLSDALPLIAGACTSGL